MEQTSAAADSLTRRSGIPKVTPQGGAIPIPFPGNYDTLRHTASKGAAVSFAGRCCRCDSIGSFLFTGWFVKRGAVIRSDSKTFYYTVLSIPLAQCKECDKMARVLPIELLPRKTYGMQVIQQALRRYIFSDPSLRKAVDGIVFPPDYAPRHSTLWR
jgi:hypothetical protein